MGAKLSTQQLKEFASLFETNPEIGTFFLDTYGSYGPRSVVRYYRDDRYSSPLSHRDVSDFQNGIQALIDLGFSEFKKPRNPRALMAYWDENLRTSGVDVRWFKLKLDGKTILAIAGMQCSDHSLVIRTFTKGDLLQYDKAMERKQSAGS